MKKRRVAAAIKIPKEPDDVEESSYPDFTFLFKRDSEGVLRCTKCWLGFTSAAATRKNLAGHGRSHQSIKEESNG